MEFGGATISKDYNQSLQSDVDHEDGKDEGYEENAGDVVQRE